jgi:hypothetical protein
MGFKTITKDLIINCSIHSELIPMKPNRFFRQDNNAIIIVSLIIMCIFSSITLKAQTPTNFSGKWEFDKTKSGPDFVESKYDGTVTRHVIQNSSVIKYNSAYIYPGRQDFHTAYESYTLDGKEKFEKYSMGTIKKSAKWTPDKKILIITYFNTQTLKGVSKDFLVVDSLKLSDNKQILTIVEYSKNPVTGETTTQKIYNKK